MTGAEILCESLTRLGVRHFSVIPAARFFPVYDALLDTRYATSWCATNRARRTWRTATRARQGGVGVAMATSGPGATNLVTGIATAMMDSSPIVCITGQVAPQSAGLRRLSGNRHHRHHAADHQAQRAGDARRGHRAAPSAKHSDCGQSGRPGPVLVDITKDAQQAQREFDWRRRPRAHARLPPKLQRVSRQAEFDRAVELHQRPQAAARFLPGTASSLPARSRLCRFVSGPTYPVAMTLLGLGGFPARHPLQPRNDGHARRSVGQQAIQEADLLIAVGMRFDDRVTGNLRTYAQNAKKIHIEIDRAEINKNVKVDAALVGDAARSAREADSRTSKHGDHGEWLRAHRARTEGRLRGARHPEPARQRPSVRRARDQRHLANHRAAKPSW